jgi:glycosyltransferase involved in cell wall biosynthesis
MALAPGISFITRIHNEEQTLEASVRSLFALTLVYEIILILHRCTDASTAIAHRLAAANSRVRVLTYNTTVARPGYETLVTDGNSTHSIPAYYNWCLQYRRYQWTAKWDADFVATPAFLDYLNAIPAAQWARPNEIISMRAVSPTHTETHDYFSSCLSRYMKHVMFEVPLSEIYPDTHVRHDAPPDATIEHRSGLSALKPYWYDPPWFAQEDTPEAAEVAIRYNRLVAEFGPEPRGLGRSGSPDVLRIGYQILNADPDYINIY